MRIPIRVAIAVLLTATALGACGSNDNRKAITQKGTTTTSVSGETTTTDAGTPSGSNSSTTAANSLHNSGQTTAAGNASIAAGSNATSPPASTSGLQPATPGKYSYTLTGTSGGQNVNEQLTATVDAPTGADQHSSTQTQQGSQDQILRYLPNGIFLVDLKISAGFISKEFKPDQPTLEYPEPAPAGKTWSWTVKSTDGKTTVTTSFNVERTENLMVGSESVPTTVLGVTIQTSGDIVSKTTGTYWISEKYRTIAREDTTTDTTTPITSHSQTSLKLNSTKPS